MKVPAQGLFHIPLPVAPSTQPISSRQLAFSLSFPGETQQDSHPSSPHEESPVSLGSPGFQSLRKANPPTTGLASPDVPGCCPPSFPSSLPSSFLLDARLQLDSNESWDHQEEGYCSRVTTSLMVCQDLHLISA
jgi:hypothetical protein